MRCEVSLVRNITYNFYFKKSILKLNYSNFLKEKLNLSQDVNGDELRKIMNENKEKILELHKQYISDLAIGISNLVNICEPDTIILGGGFAHFEKMFMEDLKNEILSSNLLFNERDDIDLRIAVLGNDAGIIGATF